MAALSTLEIELTKKCYLSHAIKGCAHCYKDPQHDASYNDTLDHDIIDDVITSFESIRHLCVNGTEPSMALPQLQQIYDSSMKKKNVGRVTVISNGVNLKRNRAFLEIIKKFKEKFSVGARWDHGPTLRITEDMYHREACERLGIDYDELIADVKELQAQYPGLIQINPMTDAPFAKDKSQHHLIYAGRARSLPEETVFVLPESMPLDVEIWTPEKASRTDCIGGEPPWVTLAKQGKRVLRLGHLSISADGYMVDRACTHADAKKYNYGSLSAMKMGEFLRTSNFDELDARHKYSSGGHYPVEYFAGDRLMTIDEFKSNEM